MAEVGEGVDRGNNIEEDEGAPGGLVEEELQAVHLELAVVATAPDGIQGRRKDTGEGEDDSEWGRRLDVGVIDGLRVVVGDQSHPKADGDQGEYGLAGECGAVEDKVHQGDGGRQQD